MKSEREKNENLPLGERERDRSIAKTYRWEETRKPSSLVLPKRVGEMRREQLQEGCRPRVGEREKKRVGEREKNRGGERDGY